MSQQVPAAILSTTERRVYDAAIQLIDSSHIPPTFVQVAEKAGVSQTTVNRVVWRLSEIGVLTFDPRAKRSLGKGKPLSKLPKKRQ